MILTQEAINQIAAQADDSSPYYLAALLVSHEQLRAQVAALRTMQAMERYGGGFVKTLAAIARADAENLAKIKATWPEYWAKYEQLVKEGE